MRYEPYSKHQDHYELHPEGLDERTMLRTIAQLSYKTAAVRGLGALQPHEMPTEAVDFDQFITVEHGEPVLLLMNYVNGRDCRTQVYKKEARWFFDGYAFEQRKVDSAEFVRGVRREKAQTFLDVVVSTLAKGGR